jgi:O-antigen/teichoic acid export membrane protein
MRRRLARNVLFSGASNVWAMVVTLISLPLMLHGLGAVGFGVWALLETFSAGRGWLSIADLGISIATTAEVSRRQALEDPRGVSRAMTSSLLLLAAMGVLCGAVVASAGPPVLPAIFHAPAALHTQLVVAILALGVRVPFEMLSEGLFACLQGLQRIDLARVADACQRTLFIAGAATAAVVTANLAVVEVASLVATLLGAGLAVALLMSHQSLRIAPAWVDVRQLLRSGWAIGGTNVFSVVHRNMDRLIVGVILGPAPVSLVEIATQVQNGADAVLAATGSPVVPVASWLDARRSKEQLRQLLFRGTKYAVLATTPLIIGAAFLAGPLVNVWVSHRYAEASVLIPLAMIYMLMVSPLHVGSLMLTGVGRARDVLRPFAVATVVNLGASIVLVLKIGVAGAFLGTLVGTAFLILPLMRSVFNEVDTTPRDFVSRSLLPVLVPAALLVVTLVAVLALRSGAITTLVIGTVTGGLVYCTVALRWSLLSEERGDLRAIVSGLR